MGSARSRLLVGQCVSTARAVHVLVFFCFVVASVTWLRYEGRKVCESRAEGCHAKLRGLYGCNSTIQSMKRVLLVLIGAILSSLVMPPGLLLVGEFWVPFRYSSPMKPSTNSDMRIKYSRCPRTRRVNHFEGLHYCQGGYEKLRCRYSLTFVCLLLCYNNKF